MLIICLVLSEPILKVTQHNCLVNAIIDSILNLKCVIHFSSPSVMAKSSFSSLEALWATDLPKPDTLPFIIRLTVLGETSASRAKFACPYLLICCCNLFMSISLTIFNKRCNSIFCEYLYS